MVFWDTKFMELVAMPQVLVTPHTAFLTAEALSNIAQTTIDNIDEVGEGRGWAGLGSAVLCYN